MLLMNGAFVLLKIWCGAEVSEAGCVQLWFSIAITKTELIRSSPAAQLQSTRFTAAQATAQNHARTLRGEIERTLMFLGTFFEQKSVLWAAADPENKALRKKLDLSLL